MDKELRKQITRRMNDAYAKPENKECLYADAMAVMNEAESLRKEIELLKAHEAELVETIVPLFENEYIECLTPDSQGFTCNCSDYAFGGGFPCYVCDLDRVLTATGSELLAEMEAKNELITTLQISSVKEKNLLKEKGALANALQMTIDDIYATVNDFFHRGSHENRRLGILQAVSNALDKAPDYNGIQELVDAWDVDKEKLKAADKRIKFLEDSLNNDALLLSWEQLQSANKVIEAKDKRIKGLEIKFWAITTTLREYENGDATPLRELTVIQNIKDLIKGKGSAARKDESECKTCDDKREVGQSRINCPTCRPFPGEKAYKPENLSEQVSSPATPFDIECPTCDHDENCEECCKEGNKSAN